MILHHYSPTPHLTLGTIRPSRRFFLKPGGIWLSDDSRGRGWPDWCVDEGFRLRNLEWRYRVEISDDIPVLDSLDEFVDFSKKYTILEDGFPVIDWKTVMEEMPGIVFSPFEREWMWLAESEGHERFMDSPYSWYSGVDCDSACVWDKNSILGFGPAESFRNDPIWERVGGWPPPADGHDGFSLERENFPRP